MEITQDDRDLLRAKQYQINSNVIGNLVEHRSQNPRLYKKSASNGRGADNQSEGQNDLQDMPRQPYRSKYTGTRPSGGRPNLWSIREDEEPELPITAEDVNANAWLNMDRVELEKLEWMSHKAEKAHHDRLKSSTLFDATGRVMICDNNDKTRENCSKVINTSAKIPTDDVKGHDMESLMNLLESTFQPQVTYALGVITKIATLCTSGYYDGAFDENLHELLIKRSLLKVRCLVDSPNETICQNALRCMRELLCNTQVDEVVLDRIQPLLISQIEPNIWLNSDLNSAQNKFTIDMKDVECVEQDAILALVERTHIVERFAYLLNMKTGQFSATYRQCMLDILIRISRHSPYVCSRMANSNIPELICENLLPVSITSAKEFVQTIAARALKFLRILATAAVHIESSKCLQTTQPEARIRLPAQLILPIVEAYFFIDCHSWPTTMAEPLFRIHIENLRFVKILNSLRDFRGGIDSLLAMGHATIVERCRTLSQLRASSILSTKISFDWQYAAHFIDLLKIIEQKYSKKPDAKEFDSSSSIWSYWVIPALNQWLTEIIKAKTVPHIDISITVATAIHHSMSLSNKNDLKDLLNVIIQPIEKEIQERNLDFYSVLVRSASEQTQLNRFHEIHGSLRDPTCLRSYGSLNFNLDVCVTYSLNYILDTNSPYILLNAILGALHSEKVMDSIPIKSLDIFVNHISLNRYIYQMTHYQDLDLSYESVIQNSLIAQFEVTLIAHGLLSITHYYRNYKSVTEDTHVLGLQPTAEEPDELRRKRVDCYNNLCYYAISLVGLLSTRNRVASELKERLFSELLFNPVILSRLADESNIVHHPRRWDYATGSFKQINDTMLTVLPPLYSACENVNRFWLYEPLVLYFNSHTDDVKDEQCNTRTEQWFAEKLPWRIHVGALLSMTDVDILRYILDYTAILILYSPCYKSLVVSRNLDEYLCLIGTIFLGSDMFLSSELSAAIRANLQTLYSACIDTNAKKPILPFQSASKLIRPLNLPLMDVFNKFVDQYEAVSYGDIAFSNLLLLFIAPSSDKCFRKKLFQERAETCLAQIRVPTDSLWSPKELFFNKTEHDPEIKDLIRRSQFCIMPESFLHYYVMFHSRAS